MAVMLASQVTSAVIKSQVVKASAILDANVLGRRFDRVIMLTLASAKLFIPHWSPEIIRETEVRTLPNIVKNPSDVPRIMNGIMKTLSVRFPDSMVTGYESVDPGFELQDFEDMHVVKAAIHSGASTIISKDRDFSNQILNQHKLTALIPDEFIENIVTSESIIIVVYTFKITNEKIFVKRPYNFEEFTNLLKSKYGMLRVALLEDNKDLW